LFLSLKKEKKCVVLKSGFLFFAQKNFFIYRNIIFKIRRGGMRLKVKISANYLPILYRHRVLSLIKEALKMSNPRYETFYSKKSRYKIPKPFCFNLVKPRNSKIKVSKIQIDRRFSVDDMVFVTENGYLLLFISSIDKGFIFELYEGFKKLEEFDFSFDNNMLVDGEKVKWKIVDATLLDLPKIESPEVTFLAKTPIVVEKEDSKPVIFENEGFEYYLNRIMDSIFKKPYIKGNGLSKPLKFTPINMKKQVVKHTLKRFREKTKKPIMFITGSVGVFSLSGDPKDIDILYKIGIGKRTAQGFGMLEIIKTP